MKKKDRIKGNKTERDSMKMMFDEIADESFTDEQVQRILAPALKMIDEGAFDVKIARKPFYMAALRSPFLPIAAAAAIALIAVPIVRYGTETGTLADIADPGPPLAATAPGLEQGAAIIGQSQPGATLTLVDAATLEAVGETVAGSDGSYEFRGVPDGEYLLIMSRPGGAQDDGDGMTVLPGRWSVSDGGAVLEDG